MGQDDLKKALLELLLDPDIVAALQEKLIEPAIDKAVKKAMETKDREIMALREELKTVKEKANELEQYSRRNCLIISALPESSGEDVSRLVKQLGEAAGVEINTADIDAAHRLGKPSTNKPRNVIVKFTTFVKRQQLYAARKQLRSARAPPNSVLTPAVLTGCFVSEHLTAQNATTMYAARQMRAKGKLCHAWTDGCRMKVRVTEKAPTRFISSIDDLIKIVGPDDQLESLVDGSTAPPAGGASAAASPAVRASAAAPPADRGSAATPAAGRASDGGRGGEAGGRGGEGGDAGEGGDEGQGEWKRVTRSVAGKK